MTKFEQMLLDVGYVKYILNCKTMKYELAIGHNLSTMVNLDHRYFHKTDTNALEKIAAGKSVLSDNFTYEDRKGEICFGLHEAGRPATLISPRPRIKVNRIVSGIVEDEYSDNSMNIALQNIPHEEILEAMYNKSICLEFDLKD